MSGDGFARQVVHGYSENDFGNLAAALSYRVFVALFPITILLTAIGSLITQLVDVNQPAQRLVETIAEAAPDDVSALLQRELEAVLQAPSGLAIAFGVISSGWSGAIAVNAAVKSLNRINGVEESRSFLKRWSIIVALTAGAGLLLGVAFFGFIVLQLVGPSLADSIGLGRDFPLMATVGWPGVFLLVVGAITLLYRFGPAESAGGWVTVGGIVFGIAWLLGNVGFMIYFNNFASYNETYGTLGGALALILWIYIGSLAFLLGAQIDALLARRTSGEAPQPRRKQEAAAGTQPSSERERRAPAPAQNNRRGGLVASALGLFVVLSAFTSPRGER